MNLREMVSGARYPVRAFFFILRHPSIWPLCIAPLLINILLVVVVWHYSGQWFEHLLRENFAKGGWWQTAVYYGMAVLLFMARLVATLVSFVTVGNLVAIPFNDLLSEQTDKIAGQWRDDRPFQPARFMREVFVLMIQEVKRIMIYLPLMMILFVAGWMGPLAPFALAGKLGVSSFFFAAEYFAYPLERRGALLLKQKMDFAREHLWRSLGFGAVMTAIGVLPLVNFLFIPLGVVGGTLLFVEINRKRTATSLPHARPALPA